MREAQDLHLDAVGIDYRARAGGDAYRAVAGVSFTVAAGEFACVVGPSGCGKTSLLLAVAGLNPISAGRITLGGEEIDGPGGELAVVFQQAALLPWRTVLGNVAYGLELRRTPKRETRRRALQMLGTVGLDSAVSRYPHELSGGMQQRVNLARALAVDPSILLMDEPFAALDAQTRDTMQTELLRVWAETRKSVMFITHHIEEAVFLGDQVVVLSPGPAAGIRERIRVPFDRPRDASLRRTPEFVALVDRIRSTLSEEGTRRAG